jgi:hypothetical protein
LTKVPQFVNFSSAEFSSLMANRQIVHPILVGLGKLQRQEKPGSLGRHIALIGLDEAGPDGSFASSRRHGHLACSLDHYDLPSCGFAMTEFDHTEGETYLSEIARPNHISFSREAHDVPCDPL